MSKINDGGAAFPQTMVTSINLRDDGTATVEKEIVGGLTKREWFATHAPEPPPQWWAHGAKTCAGYAMWNRQYADAMVAELAKGGDA